MQSADEWLGIAVSTSDRKNVKRKQQTPQKKSKAAKKSIKGLRNASSQDPDVSTSSGNTQSLIETKKEVSSAGFLKKVRKRASKGLVNVYSQYLSSVENNIHWAKSSIAFKLSDRKKCTHDLNAEEVRELLVSACTDAHHGRYFDVHNKSYLRQIVFIHLTEYDSDHHTQSIGNFFGLADKNTQILNVRVTKGGKRVTHIAQEIMQVPLKALEIEADDEIDNNNEDKDKKKTKFKTKMKDKVKTLYDYRVPEGMLSLLGYPRPIINTSHEVNLIENMIPDNVHVSDMKFVNKDTVSCENIKEENTNHDVDSKNIKEIITEQVYDIPTYLIFDKNDNSKGGIGVLKGNIPTVAETESILSKLDTVPVEISGRKQWGTSARQDNFYTTNVERSQLMIQPSGAEEDKGVGNSYSYNHPLPQKVIAIDCEMCDTVHGLELTRLSVLAEDGQVILDTLVVPDTPIIDYRQQYSGISAQVLEGVNVTLAQVQLAFLHICEPETIIVGHSLENDLIALRISHEIVFDTAYSYPHPRGLPWRRKLMLLARDFLNESIQEAKQISDIKAKVKTSVKSSTNTSASAYIKDSDNHNEKMNRNNESNINVNENESKDVEDSEYTHGNGHGHGHGHGHDSIEDAITALKLAKKKVEKGPLYGWGKASLPREPISGLVERTQRSMLQKNNITTSLGGSYFIVPSLYETNAIKQCSSVGGVMVSTTSNKSATEAAIDILTKDSKAREKDPRRLPLFLYVSLSLSDIEKNDTIENNNQIINKYQECTQLVNNITNKLNECNSNALMLASAQVDLRISRELVKRRHICSQPSTISSWSLDDENKMKSAIVKSNMIPMIIKIYNSNQTTDIDVDVDNEKE
jgi:hypothetical protein